MNPFKIFTKTINDVTIRWMKVRLGLYHLCTYFMIKLAQRISLSHAHTPGLYLYSALSKTQENVFGYYEKTQNLKYLKDHFCFSDEKIPPLIFRFESKGIKMSLPSKSSYINYYASIRIKRPIPSHPRNTKNCFPNGNGKSQYDILFAKDLLMQSIQEHRESPKN